MSAGDAEASRLIEGYEEYVRRFDRVEYAAQFARCKAAPRLDNGAKVLLYGRIDVYAPQGKYQLIVLAAKIAGEGELMARYLELKEKLQKEGLFDAARKKPLPFLPHRIGIVTSPTGAVIHDMCTVLLRRFPNLEIRLFPCQVQGAAAPESIVRGLKYFNGGSGGWNADVLIVARGGGSFEDSGHSGDSHLAPECRLSEVLAEKAESEEESS